MHKLTYILSIFIKNISFNFINNLLTNKIKFAMIFYFLKRKVVFMLNVSYALSFKHKKSTHNYIQKKLKYHEIFIIFLLLF